MDFKEKFEYRHYKKQFEKINIDDFFVLVDALSKEEAYVNKGDFAKVYKDHINESCYKVLSRPDQIRTAREEAELLDYLNDLNDLKLGFVPIPLFSISPKMKLGDESQFKNGALAMQLVDGISLKKTIATGSPVPENFEIESFFQKIYLLLEVMHKEKGVYHRDVHIGNILIERKTGLPYLIDYGNSVKLSKQELDSKIDPYHLEINGKSFDLQNDFKGLELAKGEIRRYLTGK